MKNNFKYFGFAILASVIFSSTVSGQTNGLSSGAGIFGLAIHGGAGAPSKQEADLKRDPIYRAKIKEAMDAGYAVLETNGPATDAAVAAIKVMEDAGLFDAGKGSVLNAAGYCELDAAVMDGRTLAVGGVTGVQHIKNPIVLARVVMEQSPPVLLMGDGAELFARSRGFEMISNSYFLTEPRVKQWEHMRDEKKKMTQAAKVPAFNREALGTVGCVALDRNGNLAAATSTGGLAFKLPGRVGDSPIAGDGTYANNSTCAVSGTGLGESFMRTVFGHNVSALMAYKGLTLAAATAEAMKQLEAIGGHGGCIAIDREGNVSMPFDTPAMYRGFKLSNGRTEVQLYGTK